MKEFFIGLKSLIFGTGFVFFWGWISLNISRVYDKHFGITLPDRTEIIGIILMVIGGSIGLICVVTSIVKGSGTPAPFDAP